MCVCVCMCVQNSICWHVLSPTRYQYYQSFKAVTINLFFSFLFFLFFWLTFIPSRQVYFFFSPCLNYCRTHSIHNWIILHTLRDTLKCSFIQPSENARKFCFALLPPFFSVINWVRITLNSIVRILLPPPPPPHHTPSFRPPPLSPARLKRVIPASFPPATFGFEHEGILRKSDVRCFRIP